MSEVATEVTRLFFEEFTFKKISDRVKEDVARQIIVFEEIVCFTSSEREALKTVDKANDDNRAKEGRVIFGSEILKFIVSELYKRKARSRELRSINYMKPSERNAQAFLQECFNYQSEWRPKELVELASKLKISQTVLYRAKAKTSWLGSTRDRRNGWWYITDESYERDS